MPADSREGLKTIFGKAMEIHSDDERARYLDEACAGDKSLRAELDDLLEAINRAGDFLGGSPAAGATLDPSPLETPGTVIGPYKLLEPIGEGGMGIVYMAEQQEPIRRKVALKIIKLGMDTKQVIGRFEAERQALALMDHSNIAKILDAGATESGRPYFVMDLVRGIPITEYCDQNRLSTKERLAIFIDICQAVQHAHQKGIIHRDLKPTNVLVTEHDGKPMPKIIDFGVAKATEQRLTEKTHFTEHRQLVGTPEYMSPEQATFCDADVDTRSDIYSLGVLLYQLLVGTTPFDAQALRSRGYDEICRVIRETDAPTPSKRLSTLGEAVSEISKHRQVEPSALRKLLRGDLDWIAMKALEKDRSRRYETVHSLARDIERHLSDEPVRARSPSVAYRLKKYVRKHRVAAAATVAVLAALMVGFALMAFGFSRATHSERIAIAERDRARHALLLAQQLIRDALIPTSDRLGAIADSGEVHRANAGLLEQAIRFNEQILEQLLDDPDTQLDMARILRRRAGLAFMTGEAGEPLARRSISLLKSLVDDHPDNAPYRDELAKSYVYLAELQFAELQFRDATHNYRTAAKVLEDLIERPPADPDRRQLYLETQAMLGYVLQWASEHETAEQHLRRALEIQGSTYGVSTRRHLALLLMNMNRYGDAEKMLEEARRVIEQLAPVSLQDQVVKVYWHQQVLMGFGELLYSLSRSPQAEDHLRRAIDMGEGTTDGVKSSVWDAFKCSAWGCDNLGWCYYHLSESLAQQDRFDEAETAAHRALDMWEATSGRKGRHNKAMASMRLGELHHQRGDTNKAHAHFEQARQLLGEISRELPDEPYCQKRLIVLLAHCPDPDFRDPHQAVEIAQWVKTDSDVALWRYLALSQYRSGDWVGAKASIEKLMELRAGGDPLDWILLAMAQCQLGSHDVAVQVHAQAQEAISSGIPILYLELGVLGFQRLRDEAATLLEGRASPPSDESTVIRHDLCDSLDRSSFSLVDVFGDGVRRKRLERADSRPMEHPETSALITTGAIATGGTIDERENMATN